MLQRRVGGRFAKAEVGSPAAAEAGGGRRRAFPRPADCQRYARKRLAEALPEIVDRFIREAKSGSIAHAKALTVLSGLDKAEVATAPVGGKRESFAGLLKRQMEERSKDPD